MTNRRIKKSVIYGIYSLGLIALIGTIYLVEANMPKKQFVNQEYSYVSKTIFDDIIPVISTEEKLIKPFNADDVKVIKTYYDYKADEKSQQESIIYYENTYMQNSGISYGKDTKFDVISVLPGTVQEIKEDELLGKIVTIKHSDNVTSIYQCLNETTINKGDSVIGGQVIGTSGSCNLEKDVKNNVYFELIVNNETVNPENYYGKTLKEIEG
ncbi:MAG: M23 family metallopeptidase [Bacilli bacterium]|nr:M23 family metallopeptidase [Bacilli bacterium]